MDTRYNQCRCGTCALDGMQFDLATGRRVETDLHGGIALSEAVEQRVHPTYVDGGGWIW